VIGYPGETAIIDAEDTQANCIFMQNSFNFHFENLTARNAAAHGIYIRNCGRISYKFIISHDHYGPGIATREDQGPMWGSYSDSYNNGVPNSGGAGSADGFVFGSYVSGSGYPHCDTCEWNIVGLRTWNNTDDGGDMWQNWSTVNMDSCWFFSQPPDDGGNGMGIKLGGGGADAGGGKRRINNCIFVHNSQDGLDYNSADSSVVLYNCVSMYNTGNGFTVGTAANRDTVINCVAIENGSSNYSEEATAYDVYNSWNGGVTATTADFIGSLDSTTLVTAMQNAVREASGTLPDLTNLSLASDSDLIDAGTDVGIVYNGAAPDMGAFEYIAIPTKFAVSSDGKVMVTTDGKIMVR
jgi:hypothetical protein